MSRHAPAMSVKQNGCTQTLSTAALANDSPQQADSSSQQSSRHARIQAQLRMHSAHAVCRQLPGAGPATT